MRVIEERREDGGGGGVYIEKRFTTSLSVQFKILSHTHTQYDGKGEQQLSTRERERSQ